MLIEEELAAERDWRRSLEQRALSLFASAGVIGSLAGIAARGSELSAPTRVLIGIGLGAIALAALLGLSVAYPVRVPAVSRFGLRQALEPEEWNRGADEHLLRAARARLGIVVASRDANERKARRPRFAVWCAGVGVSLLLAGVVVALYVEQGPLEATKI